MKRLLVISLFFLLHSLQSVAVDLGLHPIVSGLNSPVFITHANDSRLFVVEQIGRIQIVQDGRLLDRPFLDIDSKVGSGGERGLLSMAFHPDYGKPNTAGETFFWLNYTNNDGDTVIARYSVSSNDPNRADEGSELVLLTIDQPFSNHNGGQLQFGPRDGVDDKRYLYIGMGDGGSGGDPQNSGQRNNTLLGKMLRIDPSVDENPSRPFFSVPPNNPNSSAAFPLSTIWSKGLRNPWRFSFDAKNGALYIADVGQRRWEEINRTPRGVINVNYGWRVMEGMHCFNPSENCDASGLALPIFEYGHDNGRCSVTGGYVYRGSRFPALDSIYFFGDYCSREIFSLKEDPQNNWEARVILSAPASPLTFGEDIESELYIGTSNGIIYQLVDRDLSITLSKGLNILSFPNDAFDGRTCSDLIGLIEQTGQVHGLARFNRATQRFEICGSNVDNNFLINRNEGYLINSNNHSSIDISIEPTCPILSLNPGLNVIGYSGLGVTPSCYRLLAHAGNAALVSVQRFNKKNGRLESCVYDSSGRPTGFDFPIRPGHGYLVHAITDFELTFPGCSGFNE